MFTEGYDLGFDPWPNGCGSWKHGYQTCGLPLRSFHLEPHRSGWVFKKGGALVAPEEPSRPREFEPEDQVPNEKPPAGLPPTPSTAPAASGAAASQGPLLALVPATGARLRKPARRRRIAPEESAGETFYSRGITSPFVPGILSRKPPETQGN